VLRNIKDKEQQREAIKARPVTLTGKMPPDKAQGQRDRPTTLEESHLASSVHQ